MRSISVASGKGGVGKTSVSVNLAITLAQMGKKVVVVDADVGMANLGILLGIERSPISIHNVLAGEVDVRDAVYEGPAGVKYVPAALGMDKLARIDYPLLKQAIAELEKEYEIVLIDCPSGLGQDAENALKSSTEVLLVVTPEPASIADCLKVRKVAERNGMAALGVVLNMVTGDPAEVKKGDVETIIGEKVLVEIPHDINVRRAGAMQEPIVLKFPDAPFSREIVKLAAAITGEKPPEPSVKKGLLQTIIDSVMKLFGRK